VWQRGGLSLGLGAECSVRYTGLVSGGAACGALSGLFVCVCVLCCAALRCAVLCCAVLCCAVLCCAVLCCAVLRRCEDHPSPPPPQPQTAPTPHPPAPQPPGVARRPEVHLSLDHIKPLRYEIMGIGLVLLTNLPFSLRDKEIEKASVRGGGGGGLFGVVSPPRVFFLSRGVRVVNCLWKRQPESFELASETAPPLRTYTRI